MEFVFWCLCIIAVAICRVAKIALALVLGLGNDSDLKAQCNVEHGQPHMCRFVGKPKTKCVFSCCCFPERKTFKHCSTQ